MFLDKRNSLIFIFPSHAGTDSFVNGESPMNTAQSVPTNRLYVGNISWTVDNSVLFSAFAHVGAMDARGK